MAYANNSRSSTMMMGVLAVAASAAMIYFGDGMVARWPLMWFAMVPVLCFALRASWASAALAALATMMLGNLNLWSYLTKTLGAPAWVWFANFFVASIMFAACVLVMRALVRRGAVGSGLVALPALWVAGEYLRNLMTPHGSAGSLAYSQLEFLPFLQLASVTGPWGMSFVLLLFTSSLAIAWCLWPTERRKAQWVAATGISVAAVVIVLGAIRLGLPEGETARVGLVASDLKQNARVVEPGADTERLFSDYEHVAEGLTAQGAQAVVIPEKLGVTLEDKLAKTDDILQSLADSSKATVVAGTVHFVGPVKYNSAHVYVPGAAVARYDKEHMLPPFESDSKPGTTLVTLPREKQLWGVAICKDMDFADPARRYAREGAGLMLVPAWDFTVDRAWHGHIAVMRGVEGGFSIARAAKGGYLTVSDWKGRIIGETRSSAAPFATLLVDVPAEHHWTLYQVLGDWFAWASVALAIVVLLRLMTTRKSTERQ